MRARPATAVAAHRLLRSCRAFCISLLLGLVAATPALAAPLASPAAATATARNTTIDRAFVVDPTGDGVAAGQAAVATRLPDDWSLSRPRHDGAVRYRLRFDLPPGTAADDLLALYVERVCSNLEVHLNERRIHSGGSMLEPVSMNCRHPQLVPLPAALLQPTGNVLDLDVVGHSLGRVVSRQLSAGLSTLRIGPVAELAALHAWREFWNVTWLQASALVLVVLGAAMLALAWQNPHEVYFGYFGGLVIGWALLSTLFWLRDPPWQHAATGYIFGVGLVTLVGLAVQFLLSYAGLRSRAIEATLIAQWLLMPSSLLLGGETRVFSIVNVWYSVFCAELLLASGLYLVYTRHERPRDFWPMLGVLGVGTLTILLELDAQHDMFTLPFDLPLDPAPIVMPVLFGIIGTRLFMLFARALPASEAGRTALARRVRELTTEFEGNFSQLAELRVEQVTERERKRIAADLHDDLGAKLLTIVHTSENERITALAREALEDMRLSVKGLIGKPMRLADALADWRAETVARLRQAKIEVDWRNPGEESEHLLPSRGFVQTTRILREAVSNVVKHSQATQCNVRCSIADGQFAMTIQDNGRGIPMELDGKLDRGLGMSSMKRRAKQMRGQCLVQSGPGYGTVIALTVPL
jgi:signal transduction histidine kinase